MGKFFETLKEHESIRLWQFTHLYFVCMHLQGPSAFSEPETRAVKNFISRNINVVKTFLTFHSYSQILMYPFGHRERTYAADVDDLVCHFTLPLLIVTKHVSGTNVKNHR